MLEDSKIRAFLALVSEGSFTRAARKLGVTQPAVSAQIASLEKTVGQALFLRGAELRLTPAGRLTYKKIGDLPATDSLVTAVYFPARRL